MPRFPFTAAAIEHELEGFAEALITSPAFQAKVKALLGVGDTLDTGAQIDMASVKDLRDALDGARKSVDGLTAKIGQGNSGIDPAELDPILQEVSDLRSTVEALTKSLDKPEAAPAEQHPAA